MYTCTYIFLLLSKTLKSTSNKHKHVLLLTLLQYDRNEISVGEILSALECALEYGCIEICFNYFEKYAFGY